MVSPAHMEILGRYRAPIYASKTWLDAIKHREWEQANQVLRGLSWRFFGQVPMVERPEVRAQLGTIVRLARPFGARPEVREELLDMYPDLWNFQHAADRVLADEYAFLKSHSAMLARIRRPYYALRDRGLALLDAGDRFLEAKRRFLAPHRRLKFLLGVLVPIEVLRESHDPKIQLLGVLAGEVLALYDPEVGWSQPARSPLR